MLSQLTFKVCSGWSPGFSFFLEVQGAHPSCCNFDTYLHSARLHQHHLTSCFAQNHVHGNVCTYQINIRCKIILYALRFFDFFQTLYKQCIKTQINLLGQSHFIIQKTVIRPLTMPAFSKFWNWPTRVRAHTHTHTHASIQCTKKIWLSFS